MAPVSCDDDARGARFDALEAPGARFWLSDLTGARFEQTSLADVVMRGVDLSNADVDGDLRGLVLNGVAVAPLVEAELDRRHPGRASRRSPDPAAQLAAFEAAQRAWDATIDRAASRPALRDARADGEWSIAQTLRHLVFATDGWLRHAVLGLPDAFAPIGLPFTEWWDQAAGLGVDVAATPTWDEVLAVRAERTAQVRAFLADVSREHFAAPPAGLPPWHDDGTADLSAWSVARCLGVIGNEEWEHLRFTMRDLDAVERGLAP
ncbi:DinB family protein [Xylanimonas ulmi]|uniref:Pentapeptide repeat protein n=1 Tax=Xylanimonas ulmi TaxID=228973 RepID=A0A4Q7M2S4_9MICO|nr:DinB family protein [Xylanibacterium ulmi]RZS61784.1 pentapeptide repeat protein [Xylanibacterium ulmi]